MYGNKLNMRDTPAHFCKLTSVWFGTYMYINMIFLENHITYFLGYASHNGLLLWHIASNAWYMFHAPRPISCLYNLCLKSVLVRICRSNTILRYQKALVVPLVDNARYTIHSAGPLPSMCVSDISLNNYCTNVLLSMYIKPLWHLQDCPSEVPT